MVDGEAKYVTASSQSDVVDGWRDRRKNGGIVIDVASNDIIVTGLSMPHSPRWYQDKLWLLNSGRGELGYVDLETGNFEAVTFCPGYVRGLAFWQNWAIVGLSKPRGGDNVFVMKGSRAFVDCLNRPQISDIYLPKRPRRRSTNISTSGNFIRLTNTAKTPSPAKLATPNSTN